MEDKIETTVGVEHVAEDKVGESTPKSTDKVDYEKEFKRLQAENEKLKKAQTNAAKDASDWKAKFRATQDEATRAAEEQKEALERIMAENETLRKTQTLATHKAGWLGLGFDDALAAEAAEASVNSDFDALMATMKKFIEMHDKELKAANIRQMPAPVSGSAQSITQEQFDNMSYRERAQLFNEQPEPYKKSAGK